MRILRFHHAFGEAGSHVAFFTPSVPIYFFFSLFEISSWTSLSKRDMLHPAVNGDDMSSEISCENFQDTGEI